MEKLWLITYESAHWCGASDTKCVVRAASAEEAEDKASDHMTSEMLELFSDEYDEEDSIEECVYSVVSVEEFDASHSEWKWYTDPTQSQFYPEV